MNGKKKKDGKKLFNAEKEIIHIKSAIKSILYTKYKLHKNNLTLSW